MSRRSFRARVATPRPLAAWILVAVASASLWATRQLAPWVVAVEALLLALGFWRRDRPLAWQRSALALNLGLFAILALALSVAAGGGPSTIPLAHFAALAQALQLLDARPRRGEYLLVVLALFQVILASNLTDSVAFPPLLALFVVCAAWTLVTHTLHSEAIEAGEEAQLAGALESGLLRTTLLASGLSIALAAVFFLLLPRLQSSVVSGRALGAGLAIAGFSDRVALGDLGRIRQDPSVVLRVETLEGRGAERDDRYWRGLAFDHFDGRNWSISDDARSLVPGSPEGGMGFGRAPENWDLHQRVVREPVAAGALFVAGELRSLQGTLRVLERDGNGGLYASRQAGERVRYETKSTVAHPSPRRLVRDRARRTPRNARYLQLPPLAPEVALLAQQISADADSDAERAAAIEAHLRRHGRYSDTPPPLPANPDQSPVEAFLLGALSGHCEYFASGMVVLLRELGIPARLVNGFAGGRENEIGGFVEVAQSDAHAWVEVDFEKQGWVRFDPTPPELRLGAAAAPTLSERLRDLASAGELWWYQRVVGFDRADQIQAVKSVWLAWQDLRAGEARASTARSDSRRFELPQHAWIAALAAAAALAIAVRTSRARRDPVPASYASALALLRRRGLRRARAASASDFAREVARARPELAASFHVLTQAYLHERFGGGSPRKAELALHEFRIALRRRAQSAP
jgi:transglutaminase-like putative cysteine protease